MHYYFRVGFGFGSGHSFSGHFRIEYIRLGLSSSSLYLVDLFSCRVRLFRDRFYFEWLLPSGKRVSGRVFLGRVNKYEYILLALGSALTYHSFLKIVVFLFQYSPTSSFFYYHVRERIIFLGEPFFSLSEFICKLSGSSSGVAKSPLNLRITQMLCCFVSVFSKVL